MKVIKELEKSGIKITVFQWNNKYLIKFETKEFEQTYKIPQTEIFDEKELVEKVLSDDTLNLVFQQFKAMNDVMDVFFE